MKPPVITFNNGKTCPGFGLGTVYITNPDIITKAIEIGYRHFDTAWVYGNESVIGKGIKAAIDQNLVERKDIFVTTKLWNLFHETNDVVTACIESVNNLGLDYIDLFLIHFPIAQKKTDKFNGTNLMTDGVKQYEHDLAETWEGMEKCVDNRLTKSIGVANFTVEEVEYISYNAKYKPVMNQVKVNPLQNQKEILERFQEMNVQVTAYSPLNAPGNPWKPKGQPNLNLEDSRLLKIGKKYEKTGAQIILRYLLDIGTIPIPKTSNKYRLEENFDIFDFRLNKKEMEVIDSMNHYPPGIDYSYLFS